MSTRQRESSAHAAAAEQRLYAKLLAWGTRVGSAVLVVGFIAYVTGLLPAYVPLARLPALWGLPAKAYLAETGVPAGWGWVVHLDHGEFASVAGIAILAACSIVSLGAVLVAFCRRGDRAYAGITLAIILVMLVAASGVLNRVHGAA